MWLILRLEKKNSLNLYNWREWGPWIVCEAGKFGVRGDTDS